MNGYSTSSRDTRSGVSIPRIWITIALSVLLHALLLWQVRPHIKPGDRDAARGDERGLPLTVNIVPPARSRPPVLALRPSPPIPPPPRRPAVREAPPPRATPPRAAPKPPPPPPPPVIARNAPGVPIRPPSERPTPAPQTPPEQDLSALLEARRRARGESPPAAPPAAPAAPAAPASTEDAKQRANRLAALNLGTNRTPTFGKRLPGGGVFTMLHRGYDAAQYAFYGWNADIQRDTPQVIDVRKGDASDIRVAVVRSMIAIIRKEYPEADFTWESPRLGKVVTLSARRRDQAGLEAFLIEEFFSDDRRPIGAQ